MLAERWAKWMMLRQKRVEASQWVLRQNKETRSTAEAALRQERERFNDIRQKIIQSEIPFCGMSPVSGAVLQRHMTHRADLQHAQQQHERQLAIAQTALDASIVAETQAQEELAIALREKQAAAQYYEDWQTTQKQIQEQRTESAAMDIAMALRSK